ncbi:MAG: nuclear transport factor 2 family protein [Steroidobacteraceae bacterium]
MDTPETDFTALLQANLQRVFSERDAGKRAAAIRELYASDAILYEPESTVTGHAGISRVVDGLLQSLPADFTFTACGPAVGHHGLACLRWRAGPLDGPVAITGMDVVHVAHGVIQSLHVFLDPHGA